MTRECIVAMVMGNSPLGPRTVVLVATEKAVYKIKCERNSEGKKFQHLEKVVDAPPLEEY